MLLCYHVATLDCLDISSLFTFPSQLPCQHLATEPTDLKKACKKPRENKEQLLMCRILVQTLSQSTGAIPSLNVGGCPLSKASVPSPAPAGTCMMWSGTAGKDKVSGGKDFLSLRCPQIPLDQRHEPANSSPCEGASAGPFRLRLFLVCFAFSPLGFSLFLGVLSGPGTLPAVQFNIAGHAVPWSKNYCSQCCCSSLLQPELHGGSFQQENASTQPSVVTLIACSHQKHV